MNIDKVSKLFYGEYPYKITYKRLYGFPSAFMNMSLSGTKNNAWSPDEHTWWFDYPKTDQDRQERANCHKFLSKSFEDLKFNNGSHTHVYFKDKESYSKASQRYPGLQTSRAEPIVENLAEIYDKSEKRIIIKNSLYFKKYQYKVTFKANKHFLGNVGKDLHDMYNDNGNYRLNSNMKKFDNLYVARNQGKYIHSPYNLYAIYCLDEIDMQMVSFVASECISTITKVVLLSKIDK